MAAAQERSLCAPRLTTRRQSKRPFQTGSGRRGHWGAPRALFPGAALQTVQFWHPSRSRSGLANPLSSIGTSGRDNRAPQISLALSATQQRPGRNGRSPASAGRRPERLGSLPGAPQPIGDQQASCQQLGLPSRPAAAAGLRQQQHCSFAVQMEAAATQGGPAAGASGSSRCRRGCAGSSCGRRAAGCGAFAAAAAAATAAAGGRWSS